MGRYIEQLRNLKTRGGGTAKPTQPPVKTDEVMTVLSPGVPLVSKNLEWCQRIQDCTTNAEYFETMRDFRDSGPNDKDVSEVYRIASLKLAVLKGGGAHLQEEINRRMEEAPDRAPEAMPSAPLANHQAKAIIHKYGPARMVWERFWLWIGKQIESGVSADFVVQCERQLLQACADEEYAE